MIIRDHFNPNLSPVNRSIRLKLNKEILSFGFEGRNEK